MAKSQDELKGELQFPLGRPPNLPDVAFNPFLNHSVPIDAPWEIIRVIVMLPIILVRGVVFLLLFCLAHVLASIGLIGAKDVFTKPFPKWRRNLFWPLSWLVRALMFVLGYNYIKVKGKPVKRDIAPIMVCNHVSSIDPLYFVMAHLPMMVTAKENIRIPVAGVVMKALQCVFVDRASPTSRKDAAAEIKRRAMNNDWPHVVLFPEATTTNGRAIVSFKAGAFAPGLPVQPVVVRYPHTQLDPSWVADGIDAPMLIFRHFCNLNNEMVVEYLPPLFPTDKEKKNPQLYAERCRLVMARALNVPVTEHTFGDVALALEAQKLKMPRGVANVEFGRMEKLFRLDMREAKGYLRRFKSLDITGTGQVSYNEFLEAMDLPDTSFAKEVFNIFDTKDRGVINFREFVAGLAFISRHPQFHDKVKEVFEALDTDGDGRLSAEDAKSSLANLFPSLTEQQRQRLFNALGLDKKEFLSWEEFEGFLKEEPEYLALVLASQQTLASTTSQRVE